MGKDFKTGLIAGLLLATVVLVYTASRSQLNEKTRMLETVGEVSGEDVGKPEGEEPRYSLVLTPSGMREQLRDEDVLGEVSDEAVRVHVVRDGETLWEISKKYYGSSTGVGKIENANPGIKSTRLRAGMRLNIPE